MPGVSDFVFWGGYFKTLKTQKYYFYSMPLFEHGFSINLASSLVSIVLGLHTSEQALYCLLRLFLQKSERTHAAASPFQITTAALGCDLVWANPLDNSIYTVCIKKT